MKQNLKRTMSVLLTLVLALSLLPSGAMAATANLTENTVLVNQRVTDKPDPKIAALADGKHILAYLEINQTTHNPEVFYSINTPSSLYGDIWDAPAPIDNAGTNNAASTGLFVFDDYVVVAWEDVRTDSSGTDIKMAVFSMPTMSARTQLTTDFGGTGIIRVTNGEDGATYSSPRVVYNTVDEKLIVYYLKTTAAETSLYYKMFGKSAAAPDAPAESTVVDNVPEFDAMLNDTDTVAIAYTSDVDEINLIAHTLSGDSLSAAVQLTSGAAAPYNLKLVDFGGKHLLFWMDGDEILNLSLDSIDSGIAPIQRSDTTATNFWIASADNYLGFTWDEEAADGSQRGMYVQCDKLTDGSWIYSKPLSFEELKFKSDASNAAVVNRGGKLWFVYKALQGDGSSALCQAIVRLEVVLAATEDDIVVTGDLQPGSTISITGSAKNVSPCYTEDAKITLYVDDVEIASDEVGAGAFLVGGDKLSCGVADYDLPASFSQAEIKLKVEYGDDDDNTYWVTKTIRKPSSGFTPPPAPSNPSIIVDGKELDAGTVVTVGDTTTVTVNQDTMNSAIEAATDNVTIIVPTESGTTVVELGMQNIENMADKDVALTVQSGNVQYELPASAIDTAAVLEALGADSSDGVQISISITTDVGAELLAAIENALADGSEIIIPPMEFKVTATYNGETVEIGTFSQYVSRSVEVTEEQAQKITTAVVIEPDGTVRHVPTYVYEKDGKWYFAVINSLTNSAYALVHNEVTFADAEGKWYKASVNEMGSRMIISGDGKGMFAGEGLITRAEFAAIVVRALGLPENGDGTVFSDVDSGKWYAGAVGKAYEYGIIEGAGGGKFEPNSMITRQEAMLMIQRAAKIAGFAGSSADIKEFDDASSVSDWAKNAAEWNVGSGLIVGSDGRLRPQDNISRGETAALVLRLLQKAGLVDVRTP